MELGHFHHANRGQGSNSGGGGGGWPGSAQVPAAASSNQQKVNPFMQWAVANISGLYFNPTPDQMPGASHGQSSSSSECVKPANSGPGGGEASGQVGSSVERMQGYNHVQSMLPLDNHHQQENGTAHATPVPSPHHSQQPTNDTAFPGGQLRHNYAVPQHQSATQPQSGGHLLNLTGQHQQKLPNKNNIPKNSQAYTNDHMERHSRGEKVERMYDCPECDKAFTREEHLKRHSKVHTEDPVHRCEVMGCSKSYTRKERLTRHYKVAHLGQEPERPFWCNECGKDFQRKEHLHRHQRNIHGVSKPGGSQPAGTNPNPHQQHHVQHHQQTTGGGGGGGGGGGRSRHHGEPGQVLHCTYEGCPKTYSRREHLNRHIKLHMGIEPDRPYYCLDCGKTFTRKEHLKRHVRVHTGEHPYPCSECGRSFGRRERLVKHLKSHGINGAPRMELTKREFKKEPDQGGHGVFGDQTTHLLNMIAKKGPLTPEQLGMVGPQAGNPEVAKALSNPEVVRAFSNPEVVKAFAMTSSPPKRGNNSPATSSTGTQVTQHQQVSRGMDIATTAAVPPELSKLPPGFSIFPVVPPTSVGGQEKGASGAQAMAEQAQAVATAVPVNYYQANQAHVTHPHLKPADLATLPMSWTGWPMQGVNIRSPAKLEPGDAATKHWESATAAYFRSPFS